LRAPKQDTLPRPPITALAGTGYLATDQWEPPQCSIRARPPPEAAALLSPTAQQLAALTQATLKISRPGEPPPAFPVGDGRGVRVELFSGTTLRALPR
jgi:hypothetical protein